MDPFFFNWTSFLKTLTISKITDEIGKAETILMIKSKSAFIGSIKILFVAIILNKYFNLQIKNQLKLFL
jgi:hypothetical protein